MKIKENVLYRYESKIDGGTLFIFDLQNYKRYKGKKIEYLVLKYIDEGLSIETIIEKISKEFSIDSVDYQISTLIDKYIDKGLIEQD